MKSKLFKITALFSAVPAMASENLGEFLIHHVADNREAWHPLPGVTIPLNQTLEVGGVNLFPSLHILMIILGTIILIPLMLRAARREKMIPTSKWGHTIEALVLFIREDIVVPNMGKKHGNKWMPFFLTLFFFLLALNILGLIPGMSTATANPNFTVAMAIMVFVLFNISGMIKNGPIKYIKNLIPSGIPIPVLFILAPVEIIGLFTKSAALAIRLFANMSAGHFVVFSLLAMASVMGSIWVSAVSIPFAIFIYVLEILVAFLQAYVFTLLTSLFIGSAIHQEH